MQASSALEEFKLSEPHFKITLFPDLRHKALASVVTFGLDS